MHGFKDWLQSKTLIAQTVAAVFALLGVFHVDLGLDQPMLVETIYGVGFIVSQLFATYSRLTATKVLTSPPMVPGANTGEGQTTPPATLMLLLLAGSVALTGCTIQVPATPTTPAHAETIVPTDEQVNAAAQSRMVVALPVTIAQACDAAASTISRLDLAFMQGKIKQGDAEGALVVVKQLRAYCNDPEHPVGATLTTINAAVAQLSVYALGSR